MEVTLVELRSEISAGTRGASCGIDAMIMASLNLKLQEELRREKDWHEDEWTEEEVNYREEKYQDHDMPWNFFRFRNRVIIENRNEVLHEPIRFRWAKRIEGLIYVYEKMVGQMQSILIGDTLPFVLAGDHGTAGATIKAIKKAFPEDRIGVVWLDAHADLHSPYTSPSGNMHGMPLSVALAEDNYQNRRRELPDQTGQLWEKIKGIGVRGPAIDPEDIVFIGLRSVEVEERNLIGRLGMKTIQVREVREEGYQKAYVRAVEYLSACDRIYISFDVDCIDSTISSGTGTPVAAGLFIEEVKGLLKLFAKDEKVCCMELVEINPLLDKHGNQTAEIAFDILYNTVKTTEQER